MCVHVRHHPQVCALYPAPVRSSMEVHVHVSPPPEESKEMEASSEMKKEAAAAAAEGLLTSPALQFVTRKDLYSFLSSAGVSLCLCVCACGSCCHVGRKYIQCTCMCALNCNVSLPHLLLLLSFQDAGEAFFANRALMELVQRIRSNPSLFAK